MIEDKLEKGHVTGGRGKNGSEKETQIAAGEGGAGAGEGGEGGRGGGGEGCLGN